MEEENQNIVCEPDFDYPGMYSYADYLKWNIEERVEIIKGKIFKMSPAPSSRHQTCSSKLLLPLLQFLKDKPCQVYHAPFDVVFSKSQKEEKIFTVVQPDICVVCDLAKINDKGCAGAPDIVVEILSPSNNKKELRNKFDLYEENGVKEYWIVSPQDKTFLPNILNTSGKYRTLRMLTYGDFYETNVLPGFVLNIEEIFEGIGS